MPSRLTVLVFDEPKRRTSERIAQAFHGPDARAVFRRNGRFVEYPGVPIHTPAVIDLLVVHHDTCWQDWSQLSTVYGLNPQWIIRYSSQFPRLSTHGDNWLQRGIDEDHDLDKSEARQILSWLQNGGDRPPILSPDDRADPLIELNLVCQALIISHVRACKEAQADWVPEVGSALGYAWDAMGLSAATLVGIRTDSIEPSWPAERVRSRFRPLLQELGNLVRDDDFSRDLEPFVDSSESVDPELVARLYRASIERLTAG